MQNYKNKKTRQESGGFTKPNKHPYHREHGDNASLPEDENMIVGRNAVRELLVSSRDVDKIFVMANEREGSISVLVAEAIARKIPVIEVDRKKLDMMTKEKHQGIIAMAAERNYATISDMLSLAESQNEPPFLVIADGIEDPHNLGAIIRSAECMGAHGVIIPKRRSVLLNTTVAKASAGAIEHMLIAKVTNLASTIDELKEKNIWIYGADMDGAPAYSQDMRGAIALVLGSEGFGMGDLVRKKCDFIVSIPMYGKLNSMNVSAAGAVLLQEIAHQRHKD